MLPMSYMYVVKKKVQGTLCLIEIVEKVEVPSLKTCFLPVRYDSNHVSAKP